MTPTLPSRFRDYQYLGPFASNILAQLLPRKEGRVRLQGPEGDPRNQDPRDLGQGHPPSRYVLFSLILPI